MGKALEYIRVISGKLPVKLCSSIQIKVYLLHDHLTVGILVYIDGWEVRDVKRESKRFLKLELQVLGERKS